MIHLFLTPAEEEEGFSEEKTEEKKETKKPGIFSRLRGMLRTAGGKKAVVGEEVAEGAARGVGQGAGVAVGYTAVRGIAAGGKFVAGGIFDPLNIFIALAFIFHIIDVFAFGANPGLPIRWYMHAFLALLAWLWVFRIPDESIFRRFPVYIALWLMAIYFVYAGNYAARGINWFFAGSAVDPGVVSLVRTVVAGITNTILVPIWVYYAVFFQQIREPTRISKILAFIFAMLFIVATFSAVARSGYLPTSWEEISPEQRAQAQQVLGEARTGVQKAPAAAASLWDQFTQGISNIIMGPGGLVARAVGEDIYASQVDKNKDEPLGVYLENIQPSSEQYYEDEPVNVWATLKARTLDPDDYVHVTIACSADRGQLSSTLACPVVPRVTGDTNPDPASSSLSFDIFGFEQQDIGCAIPENTLLHGFRTVAFDAEFNFPTDAYLKAYFMETSRLRAMRRENIDPLDLYGITDRTPTAIHSNGPIAVGMITTQPLLGLDENATFRLGISLNNRWEGKIKRIRDVVIKIPESMELYGCDVSFKERACEEDECENGKYQHVYQLNDTRLKQLEDIKTAKSFNCNVRVKSGQLQTALGNVPLITHYFKASADYVYKLEKAISVNVKHPPDKPGIEPPGVSCTAIANIPSQYEYLRSNYIPTNSEEELVNTIIQNYGAYIDEAAAANPNVPPSLIVAFIVHESGGNPLEVSTAGAVGLMQLMPHTSKSEGNTRVIDPQDQLDDAGFDRRPGVEWNDYGNTLRAYVQGKTPAQLIAEDPRFDPRLNILWATSYISKLVSRFSNDFHKTTAGYNAGPHRVDEWIANGQWDNFQRSGYQCANPSCTYQPVQRPILSIPKTQSYVNRVVATFKMVDRIMNPGRQATATPGTYAWSVDPSVGNRISDCFSKVDVVDGRRHYGTDIPVPEGVSVVAIADGVVQDVCGRSTVRCDEPGLPVCTAENSCNGQGNFVEVRTDQGWYYKYMHLTEEHVARDTRVTKGQVIGKSGNTGHSTGPHIHVETYTSASSRSETAFNTLCLYDQNFIAGLTFDSTGNCNLYKDGGATFNLNSNTFRQQCLDMQQLLSGGMS